MTDQQPLLARPKPYGTTTRDADLEAGGAGESKGGETGGGARAGPPNLLSVTVIGTRGLIAAEGEGESASANPYVTLSFAGASQSTSVVQANRSRPAWNERFTFQVGPAPRAARARPRERA